MSNELRAFTSCWLNAYPLLFHLENSQSCVPLGDKSNYSSSIRHQKRPTMGLPNHTSLACIQHPNVPTHI